MLKNTEDRMNVLELAEQAKKRNVIDMAVGFAGIMPLFQEGSADLIKEKLTETFSPQSDSDLRWAMQYARGEVTADLQDIAVFGFLVELAVPKAHAQKV